MLDFLVQFFTDYGYFAVFGILILCGFGLPIPEDITLVSGGVISGLGYTNEHIMFFVGLAGVLIGDSTMFLAGRLFGYRIQRIRLFRRILSPRRFSQIQRKFKQYGLGLLFVARFLPGLRSPIFLVSGMSRRVSFITFILMDGCAALISVPVWIYMGYFFADNLDLLMEYVGDVQKAIYLALGLVVLVVLVIYLKRRFHNKLNAIAGEGHHSTKEQAKAQAQATPSPSAQAQASQAASATQATSATQASTSVSASTASSSVHSEATTTAASNSGDTPDKATEQAQISAQTQAPAHSTVANATPAATTTTDAATTANALGSTSSATPCPCSTGSTSSAGMQAMTQSAKTNLNETALSKVAHEETHEEILSKKIKDKKLISKLSKASSLAAAGKGHSQFNPGVGSKS